MNIISRILSRMALIIPGGFTVRPWLHRIRGAKIGKNVWISQMVYIDEVNPEAVTIQENCTIGLRTSIIAHFYWGRQNGNNHGEVIIERNVFIGPHCVILPNVRIGEGAVIKAGTVVSRNVPANTLWGIPQAEALARVTIPLTKDYSYNEFSEGLKPIRNKKK